MNRSGNREIGRSGDRKGEFTAEARRHGEKSGNWIENAWDIWWATLHEIFDESAYDRFLLRNNAARSVVSYRAFTGERDASIQKKPRCC